MHLPGRATMAVTFMLCEIAHYPLTKAAPYCYTSSLEIDQARPLRGAYRVNAQDKRH